MPMSTSKPGSGLEASSPLSGGMGTDSHAEGGIVAVVLARECDRCFLCASREVVVDKGAACRSVDPALRGSWDQ